MNSFVFLGAPGAGKGTLAKVLTGMFNIPHISTGDIFRYHLKEKTELGLEAEEYIKNGQLVPDSLTCDMVRARLAEDDCRNGFILDGFPRTVNQADELTAMLNEQNKTLSAVILLEAPEEVIVRRLSGRRVCTGCGATYNLYGKMPLHDHRCDQCGGEVVQRDDDKEETVRKRLMVYEEKTKPLISYYKEKNMLIEMENLDDPKDVAKRLVDILAK